MPWSLKILEADWSGITVNPDWHRCAGAQHLKPPWQSVVYLKTRHSSPFKQGKWWQMMENGENPVQYDPMAYRGTWFSVTTIVVHWPWPLPWKQPGHHLKHLAVRMPGPGSFLNHCTRRSTLCSSSLELSIQVLKGFVVSTFAWKRNVPSVTNQPTRNRCVAC